MNPIKGKIHTIPQGRAFADDLVTGMLDIIKTPNEMADSIIMLPNRRLAQATRQAFIRLGGNTAQIMPRMMPIGDVDEDAEELIAAGWDADDKPPIIDRIERQLSLSELTRPFFKATSLHNVAEAENLALAAALGVFLDQMQTAQCDPKKLAELAHQDHAEHWKKIIKFLEIGTEIWPQILREINKSDPAIWRNAAIKARATAWQQSPPKGTVIIAGSTGSIPATHQLMESVLAMPNGHIILPGLDKYMTEEDWQELSDDQDPTLATHPQHAMAALLGRLGVVRRDVAIWQGTRFMKGDYNPEESGRAGVIREAMRPAKQTPKWREIPARQEIKPRSIKGWQRIDCYDKREEAEVIALAMREVLEVPSKTAIMITGDERLAKMVAGELQRWEVNVPLTAGQKLSQTSVGQFLLLIIEAWAEDFAPIPLLAMARHRLAAAGMKRHDFREKIKKIEKCLLRGKTIESGLEGLEKAAEKYPDLKKFIKENLIKPLKPLLGKNKKTSLAEWVNIHGKAAENLSKNDIDGAVRPWLQQDGIRLAQFFQRLQRYGKNITVAPEDYLSILRNLMAAEKIYPKQQEHPRLAILTPIEARMQTADLTIIGGMNEGLMPQDITPDPWMNSAMRQQFGMPQTNWRIGHMALDITNALARPEVIITQAKRDGSTPILPSRWLRRLDAVLGVAEIEWPKNQRLQRLARQINSDGSDQCPEKRPEPKPPLKARPTEFSATGLDTLLRDPYASYARKILKLKALGDIDQKPSAADRGNITHEALRQFIEENQGTATKENGYERLIEIGESAFNDFSRSPMVTIFWRARFLETAKWFIENEQKNRPLIAKSIVEETGTASLEAGGVTFTITAKADRIDLLHDGRLDIIDYKTGGLRSSKEVGGGRALQLRVEAFIADSGGFSEIEKGLPIKSLTYWKLSGTKNNPGEIKNVTPDNENIADDTKQGLMRLLGSFTDQNQGYLSEPITGEANPYSDYRHLARVGEWIMIANEGLSNE